MSVPEVETAHGAASLAARDMRSWLPPRYSPDSALLQELDTIAARVGDLARNNGFVAGARRTHVDNVIGPRLRLVAMPDWRALGKDKEWADEWSDKVEALWRSFADTEDFDAAGLCDFDDATRLQYATLFSEGEAIALPLWLPARGESGWATTIQLVHPARLSNPNNAGDTDQIKGGIEHDRYGRPKAYWFKRTHPGDGYLRILGGPDEWERIPARMPFGRLRVIHIYEQEEVGLSRGRPTPTPVVRETRMLDMYAREELRAAVFNAMICAALETPLDQQTMAQMLGASEENDFKSFETWFDKLHQWQVPMQGGAIIPTPPGTKFQPFIPARPAGAFEAFTTAMLRHLAVGLNLPYELLSKDFSKTNYSSARAAMLEAWRYFLARRDWFATKWAHNIYWLWLEEAVNDGKIEAPGFYENRVAYQQCKWIGAGRGWIDPVKEAQAAELRMKIGVSTLETEAAEQAGDWREIIEQRVREELYERELREKLGLPLVSTEQASPSPANDEPPEQSDEQSMAA